MSRYPAQIRKINSPSQAIEESKRKTSLLKDNSWIRKNEEEENEYVDRDPNFGKSVLSRYRSTESLTSPVPAETKSTKSSPVSVQSLTKRFGGSQDELRSSTLPSSPTSSSVSKRYSSLKSPDSSSITTTSKTTVKGDSKTSTRTTTVSKDGKTTETTTTTTKSVKSPVTKTPTKTETFTERVKSSSKGSLHTPYSSTKTTRVTETSPTKTAEDKLYDTLTLSPTKEDSKTTISTTKTVTVKSSNDDAEDKLYDTLIPKSLKEDVPDSKTSVYNTKTVTVKNSSNGDDIKTTTTTRTSSTAEDDLYDTLLPKGITSPVSTSPTKRNWTMDFTKGDESLTLTSPTYTSKISSYESSSIDSPKVYTSPSYKNSSRSDGSLSNPSFSKSSIKSVYTPTDRAVFEKDLCSYCHNPFTGEAKMILDDMNINCHATCFKCEVCNTTLGHMKAGDSMWVYKHMVHCERCFEVTREKWRR